jgi:RNase H-fold protein (predicted Holliday junction resolvase)
MNILGIDFGERNIGLAISKDGFIFPLANLKYQKNHVLENNAIKYITDLAMSEKMDVIVFGETNGKLAGYMRELCGKLQKAIKPVRIEVIDEFKTSKDAVNSQIELGVSKKASRGTDHSFAAAEILKRYLEL